MTLILLLNKLE